MQPPRPGRESDADETTWIPRVTGGPPRPDPLPFTSGDEQPTALERRPGLVWALRIAGLVAVGVVAGLVWNHIQDDGGDVSSPSQPTGPNTSASSGRYQFTPHEGLPGPRTDTDCVAHSYNQVQAFFQQTPCASLTRGLYQTTVENKDILVSVARVEMRSAADAQALRDLSERSNTGNVNDVVRGKLVAVPGLASLSANDGYFVKSEGTAVVIVEGDFTTNSKAYKGDPNAEKLLDDVCADAIRLSDAFTR
ncbi:hypothetical protein SAMN05216174_101985 [Actinokineospora iranica]|uniref:Uncharacterized protein n=1 Tax=Actinokineospora iranica TaxID=1271860 RepID=A0A1G6KMC3_9PSEU|nr:hypothetical protein SAMN05216174_101985 [Actinokineospora iranica]